MDKKQLMERIAKNVKNMGDKNALYLLGVADGAAMQNVIGKPEEKPKEEGKELTA